MTNIRNRSSSKIIIIIIKSKRTLILKSVNQRSLLFLNIFKGSFKIKYLQFVIA